MTIVPQVGAMLLDSDFATEQVWECIRFLSLFVGTENVLFREDFDIDLSAALDLLLK